MRANGVCTDVLALAEGAPSSRVDVAQLAKAVRALVTHVARERGGSLIDDEAPVHVLLATKHMPKAVGKAKAPSALHYQCGYFAVISLSRVECLLGDYEASVRALERVDPFDEGRVWFHSRSSATHTEPLMGKPATGKKLELPPQCFHIDFTGEGLVKEIGFYVIDRRVGNTGGLGGAFAFFYGTGNPLPIPECQPYKPSKRFRLLNFVGKLGAKFAKKE